MTRRDQGAAAFSGYGPPQRHGWVRELAPWLVLIVFGWFAFGRMDTWLASSDGTSTYPAVPSTSGPMTNPEQIVVQVLMPTATPEPTPTATPRPVVTSTPTRGYPYCTDGMPGDSLCYETQRPQPTATIPVCTGERNGLCRAPAWEPSSGRIETR